MEESKSKLKTILRVVGILLAVLVLAWFSFVMYEYYRVNTDRRPLICFSEKKEIESKDEYSTMCYGLLYKYKEYYYVNTDTMSARELTLFFTDFKRDDK